MYETAEKVLIDQELNQELRYSTDTATWMAEMLHGSMRTSFDFNYDGSVLRSEDGGSMNEVFDDSIEEAKIIAYSNPGLLFELRRRLIEREELDDMQAMANGELITERGEKANTIVVVSDYPPELEGATQDVGGYNSSRKQAMLRIITLNQGVISVTTQSLDGSNREALEAVLSKAGKNADEGELLSQRAYLNLPPSWQSKLVDNLTDTYDASLQEQMGGKWHAGIRQPDERAYINTYEFARGQQDLLDWFTKEKLADPTKAEAMRYELAATAKARYERFINGRSGPAIVLGSIEPEIFVTMQNVGNSHPTLARELFREGRRAAARGETFSGCGVTVDAEDSLDNTLDGLSAKKLGYGNKTSADDECEYISKECPECHTKNVKTRVTKTHISGSCGCVKPKK